MTKINPPIKSHAPQPQVLLTIEHQQAAKAMYECIKEYQLHDRDDTTILSVLSRLLANKFPDQEVKVFGLQKQVEGLETEIEDLQDVYSQFVSEVIRQYKVSVKRLANFRDSLQAKLVDLQNAPDQFP